MPRIRVATKAARTLDGIVFDSKAEMQRYAELRLLVRSGNIIGLIYQPYVPFIINGARVVIRSDRYKNGRPCGYRADFSYLERQPDGSWERVIEDVKGGYQTDISRLRIAIAEAIIGKQVRITGMARR
jgi:hypothetical protein